MRIGKVEFADAAAAPLPVSGYDKLPRLAARLPRAIRFLGVGGVGLVTDLGVFTLILSAGTHPLPARAFSLVLATLVTWRLNRALTFDRSGRRESDEALRYAAVTLTAQSTSYAVFTALVLTVFAWLPQAALIIGAAAGALISYNGHRRVSFAPPGALFPPSDRAPEAASS
jgi:putative flippase GtrA